MQERRLADIQSCQHCRCRPGEVLHLKGPREDAPGQVREACHVVFFSTAGRHILGFDFSCLDLNLTEIPRNVCIPACTVCLSTPCPQELVFPPRYRPGLTSSGRQPSFLFQAPVAPRACIPHSLPQLSATFVQTHLIISLTRRSGLGELKLCLNPFMSPHSLLN